MEPEEPYSLKTDSNSWSRSGRDRSIGLLDRSYRSDRWKHLLRGWWFSIKSPPIVSADRHLNESVCVSAEQSCAGVCVCVGLGSAFPPFKKRSDSVFDLASQLSQPRDAEEI